MDNDTVIMDKTARKLNLSRSVLQFYSKAKNLSDHNEVFLVLGETMGELFLNGKIMVYERGMDRVLKNLFKANVNGREYISESKFLSFIDSNKSIQTEHYEENSAKCLLIFLKVVDEALVEYFVEMQMEDIEEWSHEDELILETVAESLKIKFQHEESLRNLKESLSHFQSIFRNNNFGITIVEPDGIYKMANPAFCRMLGYSLEELQKLSYVDVTHTENLDESIDKYKELLSGKIKYYDINKVFIKKDKSLVFCHASVAGHYNSNGGIEKIVCTIKDVTQEKKYLDSLQKSQDTYRKIFENNLFPLFIFDFETNKLDANPAFCKLLSYSHNEFKSLNFKDIIHSEDLEKFEVGLDAVSKDQRDEISFDLRFSNSNEKVLNTKSTIKALKSAYGKIESILGTVKDLTYSNEVLESISRTEARFQHLFENSRIGIMLMDADFNFLSPNPEICRMFGYTREEFLNLTIQDIAAEEFLEDAFENLIALKNKKQDSFSLECRNITKEGKDLWGLANVAGSYKDGKLDQIVVSFTDLTDLRKANELLLESEYKFKLLFNNQAAGMIQFDKEWNFRTANDRFIQILGYSRMELSNMSVLDLTHPSFHNQFLKARDEILKQKEDFFFEKVYIRKDGTELFGLVSIRPLFNRNDEFDGVMATLIDINERKKAIKEGRLSELKFQTMFENSDLGMLIYDNESRQIESINKACINLFGYSEKDRLTGRRLTSFFKDHQIDQGNHESSLKRFIKSLEKTGNIHFEMEFYRKDKTRIFAKVNAYYIPPDNKYTVIIIHDLTKDKKVQFAEQEMKAKQVELDAKNRELASYTLFLTQKNQSLNELSQQLTELTKLPTNELKNRLKRLSNKIYNDLNKQEDWLSFRIYFENIYPAFFDVLAKKFPNLTLNENRLCAYIKMKLSNREVANLLYVSTKAVETARYRLKKKMGLGSEINLNEYIANLSENGTFA